MYNTRESIVEFAHSCMNYAILKKYPLDENVDLSSVEILPPQIIISESFI